MKEIDENSTTRTALRVLSDSINDMHMEKRRAEFLIKSQQQQVDDITKFLDYERERLKELVVYWEDAYKNVYSRMKQSEKVTDKTVLTMYFVCALAILMIGFAVWGVGR